MKLNVVPARTGILWVKLGIQTFLKQPLALAGLFFMYMAAVVMVAQIPVLGTFIGGLLVPAAAGHMAQLEQEYDACRTLGVEVEWTDEAPLPLPAGTRALRFPNQARFHPLKYVRGLTRAIESRAGRIHGGTVFAHNKEDGGVTIETEAGHCIRAKAAMFATMS